MNRALDKTKLRKRLIQARLDLDSVSFANKSNLIISKLKQHPYFIEAKTIGIYVSYKHEVDTINLIKEMINHKNIVVPKTYKKEMRFYQLNSFDELIEGNYGILEPTSNQLVNKDAIDLLIVPVVGYDLNHNRLGYGGGYYDRYLDGFNGRVIGLAFSFQEVKEIPVETYDLPIEIIINEK